MRYSLGNYNSLKVNKWCNEWILILNNMFNRDDISTCIQSFFPNEIQSWWCSLH